MRDLQVLFQARDAAEQAFSVQVQVDLDDLLVQNERIAELMAVAQQLAEPQPIFFTRG